MMWYWGFMPASRHFGLSSCGMLNLERRQTPAHTDRLIMSCLTLRLEPSGLLSHDVTPPHTTHTSSHSHICQGHHNRLTSSLSYSLSLSHPLKPNKMKVRCKMTQINTPPHSSTQHNKQPFTPTTPPKQSSFGSRLSSRAHHLLNHSHGQRRRL